MGSAASVRVEGAVATARILSRGFRRSNTALASEVDGREEEEDEDAASLGVVVIVVVVNGRPVPPLTVAAGAVDRAVIVGCFWL